MRARVRAGGGATVVETGAALVTEISGRCRQLPTAGMGDRRAASGSSSRRNSGKVTVSAGTQRQGVTGEFAGQQVDNHLGE